MKASILWWRSSEHLILILAIKQRKEMELQKSIESHTLQMRVDIKLPKGKRKYKCEKNGHHIVKL
uniref:Uncharacterized protein n=1 Tax=Arion vulgaris TaxID=1028688 RepID=A0A0B6Z0T6_9EUPU